MQYNQAVLDFLATTDVGRTAGQPVAEDGERATSEASEWEDREREERLALLREEEERLGGTAVSFCHSLIIFLLSFFCYTSSGGETST